MAENQILEALKSFGVYSVEYWGGKCPFQAEILRWDKAGKVDQIIYFRARGFFASVSVVDIEPEDGAFPDIENYEEKLCFDPDFSSGIQPYQSGSFDAGYIDDGQALMYLFAMLKDIDSREL